MDKESLLQNIKERLQAIEKDLKRIEDQENSSSLETDLLLKHIQNLYEDSLELKDLASEQQINKHKDEEQAEREAVENIRGAVDSHEMEEQEGAGFEPEEKEEQDEIEPKEEQAEHENVVEEQAAEEISEDNSTHKEPGEQADMKENETASPENAETVTTQESHSESSSGSHQQTPLYQKFKNQKTSLHDRLKEREKGKALADKFKLTPIRDLKSAIGLNEKAVFIHELFNNDKEAYNTVISKINEASTYQEALSYLDNTIKHQYNWDEESQAVEKLMELIYRRFMN